MGAAANLIARLLERYRWITYIGLAIVLYVALNMIWHGGHEVLGALGASRFPASFTARIADGRPAECRARDY